MRNNKQRQNRKPNTPRVYTGPALKQQANPMTTLTESQKFFVRALNHCHFEIQQVMHLIAKTPAKFQKSLRIKKAKLQREADYITNVKLEGVQLWI